MHVDFFSYIPQFLNSNTGQKSGLLGVGQKRNPTKKPSKIQKKCAFDFFQPKLKVEFDHSFAEYCPTLRVFLGP